QKLAGELPVIVFAGAPFTLASYCIGTGKDLSRTRAFAAEYAREWDELLHRLASATIRFLRTLVGDGAHAYQLFDSWAGGLDAECYQQWALSFHQAIFREVTGVPRLLFVKECPYLQWMTQASADVVSLGTQHDLAESKRAFPHLVFQGNVDQK